MPSVLRSKYSRLLLIFVVDLVEPASHSPRNMCVGLVAVARQTVFSPCKPCAPSANPSSHISSGVGIDSFVVEINPQARRRTQKTFADRRQGGPDDPSSCTGHDGDLRRLRRHRETVQAVRCSGGLPHPSDECQGRGGFQDCRWDRDGRE